MKIYYSPYFNGHSYIDYSSRTVHNGGLMGETLEATEGLLSRLELMCGMPKSEAKSDERIKAYHTVLMGSSDEGDLFYSSLLNDDPAKERFPVTTELLRWRDTLIMAGWDRESALPGKLASISKAEKEISAESPIGRGCADRWWDLLRSGRVGELKSRLEIEVLCPKVLVEPLVQHVIAQLTADDCYQCEHLGGNELKDCRVLQFNELYEAFLWLSEQSLKERQVVVCDDGQRLDNVLRAVGKPITSGDANTGCHHVVGDIRSMLDIPESVVWIDCNGGYRFAYPYDFLSEEERVGLGLPTEMEMMEAVHSHYVSQLNSIKDVTLVSSVHDRSQLLVEHPMVASVLHKKSAGVTATPGSVTIPQKSAGNEIHFERQLHYDIKKNVEPRQADMSATTLEKLIQHPFDHIVEKELSLYEPFNETNVIVMKGNVAHKVVELMVGDGIGIDPAQIDTYLERALDIYRDPSLHKCLLELDENLLELDDLKTTLEESLTVLKKIIDENELEIVGTEVAIPQNAHNGGTVNDKLFGPSKAYIDMVLKKREVEDYYIFDFKYSQSKKYAEKIAANKSIQFAFYKQLFEHFYAGGGKKVNGYGYYLFPLSTLFVPNTSDNGGLHGEHVELVDVDTTAVADTLAAMKKSFDFRKDQFATGVIEEGEAMKLDPDYTDNPGIFPLDIDNDKKKEKPFVPTHIVLKNQIR